MKSCRQSHLFKTFTALTLLLCAALPPKATAFDERFNDYWYDQDDVTVYNETCGEECCFDFMNPCCPDACWSPVSGCGPVEVAPCYSFDMLSRLHYRSIKPLVLLNYKKYFPCSKDVIISAQLRASAFYGHTNEKDKFGYLGRFPSDFRGHNASMADVNDFTIALTYSPLSWVHGYWEFLHSDHITFSTDPRQGANHTQKVYALIGDFTCNPLYFTIGKKDVSFGQMYTVNPFSPSITWHYFGPLDTGAAIGYYNFGLYFEATLLEGGRGIRVTDTNEKGRLDNWAFNGSYEFTWNDFCIKIGGGYLYSTIYDGPTPEHTGPESKGPHNPIWNANIELRCNKWQGYVEYTTTEHAWPSTGHQVTTISTGASYCWQDCWFCNPTVISFEYGEGIQGDKCEEYRKNFQFVTGIDYRIKHNVRFSFEYVRAGGFAPLMNIAVPGVSKQKTREDLVQLGLTLVI